MTAMNDDQALSGEQTRRVAEAVMPSMARMARRFPAHEFASVARMPIANTTLEITKWMRRAATTQLDGFAKESLQRAISPAISPAIHAVAEYVAQVQEPWVKAMGGYTQDLLRESLRTAIPPMALHFAPLVNQFAHWPVRDLMKSMEPLVAGPTLLLTQFSQLQAGFTSSLQDTLCRAADFGGLLDRFPLIVARRARRRLETDPTDLSMVEELLYDWLDFSRPDTREKRQALLDAAVEVLLQDQWAFEDGDDLHAEIETRNQANSVGYVPVWDHQINRRQVGSLDRLVANPVGGDGVALITTLPGPHDVERAVIGDDDVAVGWFTSRLAPTAVPVLMVWLDDKGYIDWPNAAEVCGLTRDDGDRIRRRVIRLFKEFHRRYPDRRAVHSRKLRL